MSFETKNEAIATVEHDEHTLKEEPFSDTSMGEPYITKAESLDCLMQDEDASEAQALENPHFVAMKEEPNAASSSHESLMEDDFQSSDTVQVSLTPMNTQIKGEDIDETCLKQIKNECGSSPFPDNSTIQTSKQEQPDSNKDYIDQSTAHHKEDNETATTGNILPAICFDHNRVFPSSKTDKKMTSHKQALEEEFLEKGSVQVGKVSHRKDKQKRMAEKSPFKERQKIGNRNSFSCNKANLGRHSPVLTGEKPYKCTQCDKAFSKRGYLTNHLRVHSGEKTYKCSQCDKAFSKLGYLTRHLRVHSCEKPHKCSQCNKEFSEKLDLVTHMRNHSGEKPHKVSQGEKEYLFKVSLNRNIYRQMALKGTSSLYEFAETITEAFNFQLDHCFGFYSNINNTYKSNEVYTLFYDNGLPVEPNEKSVRNSYIYQVFEPGKKMIFLFDYGDDWEFLVKCCGIFEAEAGARYPKITKKQGEAPPQYPDYDDSDYE